MPVMRYSVIQGFKQSLVAEVSVVCVVSGQVSVIGWCGTEEDGGGQVITSCFEELIHVAGHARFNGYPITWKVTISPFM